MNMRARSNQPPCTAAFRKQGLYIMRDVVQAIRRHRRPPCGRNVLPSCRCLRPLLWPSALRRQEVADPLLGRRMMTDRDIWASAKLMVEQTCADAGTGAAMKADKVARPLAGRNDAERIGSTGSSRSNRRGRAASGRGSWVFDSRLGVDLQCAPILGFSGAPRSSRSVSRWRLRERTLPPPSGCAMMVMQMRDAGAIRKCEP